MGSTVRSVTRQEACPLQDERATEVVHAAYPKRDMDGLHGWVYTILPTDVIKPKDRRRSTDSAANHTDAIGGNCIDGAAKILKSARFGTNCKAIRRSVAIDLHPIDWLHKAIEGGAVYGS